MPTDNRGHVEADKQSTGRRGRHLRRTSVIARAQTFKCGGLKYDQVFDMEVTEKDMGMGLMAVDRLMPIEIYRGIRNLTEGELETLLLLLDSELTEETLVRREESKILLMSGGLLSESDVFKD